MMSKKGRKPGIYALYKGDDYLMSVTIEGIAHGEQNVTSSGF